MGIVLPARAARDRDQFLGRRAVIERARLRGAVYSLDGNADTRDREAQPSALHGDMNACRGGRVRKFSYRRNFAVGA